MTEINEYQNKATETAVYGQKDPIGYCILGLTGEAGELANKYKKVLRGDKELTDSFRNDMIKELGDVQWYVAMLAKELGYSLQEVCNINIAKLQQRRENNTIMGDGDNR